jgi:hypothetical protein
VPEERCGEDILFIILSTIKFMFVQYIIHAVVATTLLVELSGVRVAVGPNVVFLFYKIFRSSLSPTKHGTGGSLLRVNWPGREVNHSHSSRTEFNIEWSYTSGTPIRLHNVRRGNFTLFSTIL